MQFGNIEGLVNGTESVVYDSGDLLAAASSISTGNILNGDEDGEYTIIIRVIGAGTGTLYVRVNGDEGASYGVRGIKADNTTVADYSETGATGMQIASVVNTYTSFIVLKMYAKSGAVRLFNFTQAHKINGTAVDRVVTAGGVWNNTTDNVISLSLVEASTFIGVGSRMIVLKSNNFTNGTPTGVITTPYIKGSWVRVGSQVLTEAASSVTFSGLDGDRDVIYLLEAEVAYTGNGQMSAKFNGDASASNYGQQLLYGIDTTVGAVRYTNLGTMYIPLAASCVADAVSSTRMIMFAKSGFIRPIIESSLTIRTSPTVHSLEVGGGSWSNTADNLTEIVALANSGTTFKAGSQISLYALRPNG